SAVGKSRLMSLPPRTSRIGLLILLALMGVAVFAPLLTRLLEIDPYDPVVAPGIIPPTPPDARHWLGTDSLGRDLLARILYGARVSLGVGVLAEAIALFLGLLVGGVAGFYGGRVDEAVMRIPGAFFSRPPPP